MHGQCQSLLQWSWRSCIVSTGDHPENVQGCPFCEQLIWHSSLHNESPEQPAQNQHSLSASSNLCLRCCFQNKMFKNNNNTLIKLWNCISKWGLEKQTWTPTKANSRNNVLEGKRDKNVGHEDNFRVLLSRLMRDRFYQQLLASPHKNHFYLLICLWFVDFVPKNLRKRLILALQLS